MYRQKTFYTLTALLVTAAQVAPVAAAECIAPSNPGGGWDFTCRSVGKILADLGQVEGNVQVTNMPGGVGAVGFAYVAADRAADAGLLVATSTVAVTQIAQGKYPGGLEDARFLAMLGADVGVIAVDADSPYQSLADLTAAMRETPDQVIGAGDGAGSWDHIRYLLVAKESGVQNITGLRWVQFDGGTEAITQMMGGQIGVVSTDLGEAAGFLQSGDIRLLAVLSDQPVPAFPDVPTAQSQGVDVTGYNWRGFYTGKDVSDADYAAWLTRLEAVYASDDWKQAASNAGLIPNWLSGAEFQSYLAEQEAEIEEISRAIGIIQ
ncbi:MAG: tripartite tricarboxylate transporter substrate-binding protein [Pseudomonadota bacterium]|nr:tripartite tricarboxylate transporter substrate-binding protein [Pseudomonadota bacterium]MEE3070607.1 tripartite tricarboxylate transporter substrate-binding protein [Pseudomonadota bacterium]